MFQRSDCRYKKLNNYYFHYTLIKNILMNLIFTFCQWSLLNLTHWTFKFFLFPTKQSKKPTKYSVYYHTKLKISEHIYMCETETAEFWHFGHRRRHQWLSKIFSFKQHKPENKLNFHESTDVDEDSLVCRWESVTVWIHFLCYIFHSNDSETRIFSLLRLPSWHCCR